MSKKAKNANKAKRRTLKAARKKANYLRYGPKVGQAGRRQQRSRYNSFIPGKPRETPVELKTKRAGGKKRAKPSTGRSGNFPKFPLRPLRKRFHLGAAEIRARKDG